MKPIISIIIPVYNVEHYIYKCLESIRSQTYKNIEIIIINDGSTDNSLSICQKFAQNDYRYILINQKNSGASHARNVGIELAQGKYICFVDADDWIEENYIEEIAKNIKSDIDIIFWGYTIDSPLGSYVHNLSEGLFEGKASIDTIYQMKRKYEYGFTVTCCLKREIIIQNNIRFPENISLHEDIVFINKYCRYVQRLYILDLTGYHYMKFSASSLSRRFISSDEAFNIAYEVFNSSVQWHNQREQFYFELKNFINYLTLSVINLYSSKTLPKVSRGDRILRIKQVLFEINRYNFPMQEIRHKRKYILALRNASVIDLIYCFKSLFK